ncbi:MAG: alpha/beta fold hydrolase, partial [Pseudomonadota bacterium]
MTHSMRSSRSFWMGLLIICLTCAAHPLLAQDERWPELTKCELIAPGGLLSAEAMCGTLTVPENHAAPDGTTLDLAWAVIPARLGSVEPDPIVFLAGGPGQSARDVAPMVQGWMNNANRSRDLIFLDQRGTGGSNALTCEFDDVDLMAEVDYERLNEQLRSCMQDNGAALDRYTTRDGADDLEYLRQSIGVEQLNLVGGSYGTRMAQDYQKHYPNRVRSVIIDGVVPTRLKLGSEHAEKLDQSLERLFAACQADAACDAQFPDLS